MGPLSHEIRVRHPPGRGALVEGDFSDTDRSDMVSDEARPARGRFRS